MATSKVEICNQALSLISQEPIVSIDSPVSELELICAKWYDQARRQTLALHPWNFAKTRFLAPETTAPIFGYEHAYTLPSDYVRMVQIGKTRQSFVTLYNDYSVENGTILINYDQGGSLPVVYTKDVEAVIKYSPWFVNVMNHQLALLVSPEVNRTQTEIQTLESQAQAALQSAKMLEGQESPVITVMNSKYKTGVNGNFNGKGSIY